jgi:nucleoside-diphosphate-sugar epimerase
LAAAKVGGIHANNTYPAEFIYDNLMVQANVIHEAYKAGIQKILFLGSSCIYPKAVRQPMREDALLSGILESTNEPYAVAKIAGIKLVQSYRRQYSRKWISAMPTNLYGIGDNFHPENSHVLPAMIRRFHEAKVAGSKSVTLWGSGTPRREFLHVDDLAAACIFLLENFDGDVPINVGSGTDITIRELAQTVANVVGFEGSLDWDDSKPDGTPRKLLDTSRINQLGWAPSIDLNSGIRSTYNWFTKELKNNSDVRL